MNTECDICSEHVTECEYALTSNQEKEDIFKMVQETLFLSEEIKQYQKEIDQRQNEIIRQLFLVKAKILD